ncbi:MAG: hypothetical protein HY613_09085 [Candidatus Rokubacteria bacterium]|nr:hypothetical protein [Candidatus Rokubacteria bacterium]
MKLSKRSRLADVARCVAIALQSAGIRAVLTGGACASLYSRGGYKSSDLDFVIQNAVSEAQLDDAMAGAGFRRVGNQYEHPDAPFFVEFPAGPLGIGHDLHIHPVKYPIRRTVICALSATDSCRDRLAAFYHWNDRQALRAAVAIARRHRVDLQCIRRWSAREGALAKHAEFMAELRRGTVRVRSGRRSR